jgi:hypothetical protein
MVLMTTTEKILKPQGTLVRIPTLAFVLYKWSRKGELQARTSMDLFPLPVRAFPPIYNTMDQVDQVEQAEVVQVAVGDQTQVDLFQADQAHRVDRVRRVVQALQVDQILGVAMADDL